MEKKTEKVKKLYYNLKINRIINLSSTGKNDTYTPRESSLKPEYKYSLLQLYGP